MHWHLYRHESFTDTATVLLCGSMRYGGWRLPNALKQLREVLGEFLGIPFLCHAGLQLEVEIIAMAVRGDYRSHRTGTSEKKQMKKGVAPGRSGSEKK